MYSKRLVPNVRPGATGAEVIKMYALARVMLRIGIPNIQASWVKEGPKLAQMAARRGRQRLQRHADQREHLHVGRRASTASSWPRASCAR